MALDLSSSGVRLMQRRDRGEEPPVEAPTEDIALLREIRDALHQRSI